jgi:5-methylcytosine-specific restriction endonuclease McrA
MSYSMPIKADEAKLYGHVASLPCQRCGAHGVQVAHSNSLRDGKGKGLKAYPWRVAALCPACHLEIDSGARMSKQERREAWDEAHRATIGELFSRGLVRPA